jgi:DNA-binding CsgD family transcriptional regulator
MTSHNFWRVRPFEKRIRRKYGMSPSEVIGQMRFDGKRWVDIARILKCSQGTISAYMRDEDKGYHNITPEGREVKRQSAIRLNERMATGEVKRGGFAKTPLDMVNPARPYDTGSRL